MNNTNIKDVFYKFIVAINTKDFVKFPQFFNDDVSYTDCQGIETKGINKLVNSFKEYFDKYCKTYVIEVLQYNDNGFFNWKVGLGDYALIVGMAGGEMAFETGKKFIWYPICFRSCFNNDKIFELIIISDRLICPEAKK